MKTGQEEKFEHKLIFLHFNSGCLIRSWEMYISGGGHLYHGD